MQSFSNGDYRAFIVLSPLLFGKLVPTGIITDTHRRNGFIIGSNLVKMELYAAIVAKEAEELNEIQQLLQDIDALSPALHKPRDIRARLAGEFADFWKVSAYARQRFPNVPLETGYWANVPSAVAYWAEQVAAIADGHYPPGLLQEWVSQLPRSEETVRRLMQRRDIHLTQADIDTALRRKRDQFGDYEGWAVEVMVLPRADELCTRLADNPGWKEMHASRFNPADTIKLKGRG